MKLPRPKPDLVPLQLPLDAALREPLEKLANLTGLSPSELVIRLLENRPDTELCFMTDAWIQVRKCRRDELAADTAAGFPSRQGN